MAKSDGVLLSLSYADDDLKTLIAVEQFESSQTGLYTVEIYKHNIYEETTLKIRPKQKLVSFNIKSRVPSCEQIKATKRYVLNL